MKAVRACAANTTAMLAAATAEDWQEVARLEKARRACVADVDLTTTAPAERTAVVEALRELVSLDARLRESAASERDARLGALRQARGKARASAVYRGVDG
jgi:hypothetical protein